MEEDIKILKEVIEHKNDYDYAFGTKIVRPYSIDREEIQAIENILGRLEQLEKEKEEAKCKSKGLKAWQLYAIVSHLEEELKNCIPKSVIREKIEELKDDGCCRNKYYKGECVVICKNYITCEVLKELLGEEK